MKRDSLALIAQHQKSVESPLEAINFYQNTSKGAKNPVTIRGTPGTRYLFTTGIGPGRGNGLVFQEAGYFVSGTKLIRINSELGVTEVGTLLTSFGYVTMSSNGNQLFIRDSAAGYNWNGTTFTQVTDPDYPPGRHSAFVGGFTVLENSASVGQFSVSDSYNSASYQPLNFATAELSPDRAYVPFALHNELLVFGEDTTEVYRLSSNPDFPFEPVLNTSIGYGVQAPRSVVQADNTVYWLSSNREGHNVFLRLNGYIAHVVSTRELEEELAGFTLASDCESYSYQAGGHVFVVFTFVADDRTFVYDITEDRWHRRSSSGLGRHIGSGYVFFQKRHILGSVNSAEFLEYRDDVYTDGRLLNPIRRELVLPHIHNAGRRLNIHRVEFDFDAGIGVVTGQGSQPKATVYYSKNRGKTFSAGTEISLGALGEFFKTPRVKLLGVAFTHTLKIVVADPVRVTLLGVYFLYTPLDMYEEPSEGGQ